jgi:hypothetical protein
MRSRGADLSHDENGTRENQGEGQNAKHPQDEEKHVSYPPSPAMNFMGRTDKSAGREKVKDRLYS